MEIPFKDGAVVYEDGRIHKFGVSVMSWQFDELSPAYPLEIISPDELVAFEGEVKREGFTENNLPGTNQPVPTGVGRANENLVMRIFSRLPSSFKYLRFQVYNSQAALVSLGPIWVYSAPTFHVKVRLFSRSFRFTGFTILM